RHSFLSHVSLERSCQAPRRPPRIGYLRLPTTIDRRAPDMPMRNAPRGLAGLIGGPRPLLLRSILDGTAGEKHGSEDQRGVRSPSPRVDSMSPLALREAGLLHCAPRGLKRTADRLPSSVRNGGASAADQLR